MQGNRVIILGVCGKLMAGVAKIAHQKGFEVVGYDRVYQDPMRQVLLDLGIELNEGYPESISLRSSDHIIVGNQIRPSEPIAQYLIAKRVKLYSAPEWLMEYVLRERFVIAVSGSHGKTTITSMIAYMLTKLGKMPGYLIGGVCPQLSTSSELGEGKYFVIEADEYDAAFFDKRPKFHHYWPNMLVISELEFDHSDIFDDLSEIIKQFKFLLRLLPKQSHVVACHIPSQLVDQIKALELNYTTYGHEAGQLDLSVLGDFNQRNAQAALSVGQALNLDHDKMLAALSSFKGAARRQCCMYEGQVSLYDDFAHHPTELKAMIDAFSHTRLVVVYHPATYTQRMGEMDDLVVKILSKVAHAIVLCPPKHKLAKDKYTQKGIQLIDSQTSAVDTVIECLRPRDTVLVMSAYYLKDFWEKLLKDVSDKFTIEDCI